MSRIRILRILTLLAVACLGSASFATNIGPDDLQVSVTGPAGTPATDAFSPAVAFDTLNRRYLVVWSADADDGEFRIMGRRLTGAGGRPVGEAFAIGEGPEGSDQLQPAVAFSAAAGHFLVVWSGDELNRGCREIMGRLVGSEGPPAGPAFRISDMGSDDRDPAFDAVTPDVAWHDDLKTFVVVWAGDDDAGLLSDGRFEIYGQQVKGSTGSEVGANDFRISFSLGDEAENDVLEPTLAVVPGTERWYVAFAADVSDDPVHDAEIWMYGCTADSPDPSGIPISLMGGGYFDGVSARHPDLAWLPGRRELLCVWSGEAAPPALSPAIYGQRLATDGTPQGAAINLSSGGGPVGGDQRAATFPALAVNPANDEWFVTWQGDLDDGLPHHDFEVWGRRFDGTGNPLDPAPIQLSAMDPVLEPVPRAGPPAVAINPDLGYKLVAWSGDRSTTNGGSHEIFVQAWSDDGVTAAGDLPPPFALHGAAPNPFNPATTIAFDLPRAESVHLKVYDAAGKLVRTLRAGARGVAGRNEVRWDGTDDHGRAVASGVYLYRIETPSREARGRMLLVR